MLEKAINKLAANPKIFIFLRKVLENNFRTQKAVINYYLSADKSEPILDIGCGTGEFSVFFKPENYFGVDIEKKYIEFAKKNYRGNFILGDAKRLPLEDQSFSRALIVGVLHHLNDSDARHLLVEARRVLKNQGIMLVLEDVNSKKNNFLTNSIHKLDKGKYIRTEAEYRSLLSDFFTINKNFRLRSGLGAYQVFLLTQKNG